MLTTFSGTNNKLDRDDYLDMMKFMLPMLLTKKEMRGIELHIEFESDDTKNMNGYIYPNSRRKYVLYVRPTISAKNQKMVFAHELVHLKQYLRKELCPSTGKALSKVLQKLNPDKSDDYYDHPCEIEAFGRAVGLVVRYDRKNKG